MHASLFSLQDSNEYRSISGPDNRYAKGQGTRA
jgi:hypothetical protein